jgi:para-nitrobenzyl esterase
VADAVAETAYGKSAARRAWGQCFQGIPYGGSTAGSNRFMPPTKPAAWTGIRDAFDYGSTAPQGNGTDTPRPGSPAQGEDCLVLNVFTPAVAAGEAAGPGVAARRRILDPDTGSSAITGRVRASRARATWSWSRLTIA